MARLVHDIVTMLEEIAKLTWQGQVYRCIYNKNKGKNWISKPYSAVQLWSPIQEQIYYRSVFVKAGKLPTS